MASSVDFALIKNLKAMYIGDSFLSVRSIRTDGKFLYILLDGIVNRNDAEALRGKVVYADTKDLKLPEGTFFVEDIIGCTVVDTDGESIGELTDVLQNGVSADVYVVKTPDGKNMSFPFIKQLKAFYDKENNAFVVDAQTVKETALYED